MTLEESIYEKFTFIRKVVLQERFIKMEGLSGEIPFWIAPYEVKAENQVNTEIGNLVRKLHNEGIKALCIDLFELSCELVEQNIGLEDMFAIEQGMEKLFFIDALQSTINIHERFIPAISERIEAYKSKWTKMFFQLHRNEEELNRQFIEIYGLQDELTPDVPLEEITILQEETSIENGELVFHADEVFAQFVSYAVGCMFGRYSLDKEGLILANQGETLQDYLEKVGRGEEELTFVPDRDNIIPVLDDEWFRDDIVERFYTFLKASFGEENFRKNLDFVEESLGMDIRKYFTRNFYKDHIRRYKKRPIYWMFSSPKGYFNVLVYLHRYTPDTINRILNSYLKEFIEKLKMYRSQQEHIEVEGSVIEQNKARKEIDRINVMLEDCMQYETEILYPPGNRKDRPGPGRRSIGELQQAGKCRSQGSGIERQEDQRESTWVRLDRRKSDKGLRETTS
jgi:hypothetical protein